MRFSISKYSTAGHVTVASLCVDATISPSVNELCVRDDALASYEAVSRIAPDEESEPDRASVPREPIADIKFMAKRSGFNLLHFKNFLLSFVPLIPLQPIHHIDLSFSPVLQFSRSP